MHNCTSERNESRSGDVYKRQVYTEDKYGNREEYSCDGTNPLEVPLVVKSVNNLVRDARKVQQTILMVGDITDIYVTKMCIRDRISFLPLFGTQRRWRIPSLPWNQSVQTAAFQKRC